MITHDGVRVSLLDTSATWLHRLVYEAWVQQLAFRLGKRKDFQGLQGISTVALRRAQRAQPPGAAPCLDVLREGAFVDPGAMAKFDMMKITVCPLCHEDDSLLHRMTQCTALSTIHGAHHAAFALAHTGSIAQTQRLLPRRSPLWSTFRQGLHTMPDSWRFAHRGSMVDPKDHHLFTDGSCLLPEIPELSLGAWAIIDSSTDCVLAADALVGLVQNSDRAELHAMVVAVEWCAQTDSSTTIWSDSAYALEGAARLSIDIHDLPDGADLDLWRRLQATLPLCMYPPQFQHVPAQRGRDAGVSPLDDWMIYWNDRADRAARRAHANRPRTLQMTWRTLVQEEEQELQELCLLQDFHFDLSTELQKAHPSPQGRPDDFEEDEITSDSFLLIRQCVGTDAMWTLTLSDDWSSSVAFATIQRQFGQRFSKLVLEAILEEHDEDDAAVFQVSWLELVFWLHAKLGETAWPLADSSKPATWADPCSFPPGARRQPTVAAALLVLKTLLRCADRSLSLGLAFCSGLDLSVLSVAPPQTGLLFRIKRSSLYSAARAIQMFTSRRPIRTTNDLSRSI